MEEYSKETLVGFVKNLRNVIVKNSVADNWSDAVKEWQPVDLTYDPDVSSICVCGHPNLFYLYTIRNMNNGKELFPIGSSCIQRFKRKELTSKMTSFESVIAIYKAMMNWEPIEFSNKYFSRNLIEHIYERDGFHGNSINGWDAADDCKFMLRVFNKRYKHEIPESDWIRVDAIMKHCILPFMKREGEKSLVALKDEEKVDLGKYVRKTYKRHKSPNTNPDYIAMCNIAYSSNGKKEAKSNVWNKIKWQETKKTRKVNKKYCRDPKHPDFAVKVEKPIAVEPEDTKIQTPVQEEKHNSGYELRFAGEGSCMRRGKRMTLEVYVGVKIDD